MKVLCLHAYGQNSQTFRQATGSFRKLFKKFNFEFVFADAPHQIDDPKFETGQLAWYFVNKSDRHLDPKGLDESMQCLNRLLTEHEPVGVVGFSQGASIFSLHCAHGDVFPSVKFAMVFGAPLLNCVGEKAELLKKCDLPVLVVSGANDQVIPWAESEQLSSSFGNSQFFKHEGGHYVPSNNSVKTLYLDFISSCLEQT